MNMIYCSSYGERYTKRNPTWEAYLILRLYIDNCVHFILHMSLTFVIKSMCFKHEE